MNEYKDISELLESDSGAMAFYNTLPISLQQKMHAGGVGAFKQLYESSRSFSRGDVQGSPVSAAASANELTGAMPAGGNTDYGGWNASLSSGGAIPNR